MVYPPAFTLYIVILADYFLYYITFKKPQTNQKANLNQTSPVTMVTVFA